MAPTTQAHYKELLVFAAISAGLYALWRFGYENYLASQTFFDYYLNNSVAKQAAALIGVFRHQTAVVSYPPYQHLIVVDALASVSVATACNGLPMLYLFAAFILAYPGPWRRKVWFIPAGLLAIHVLNLLRIAGLSHLVNTGHRWAYELNHKYLFQIIVYGAIGLFWVLWISYLGQATVPVKTAFKRWLHLEFITDLIRQRKPGTLVHAQS